MTAAMAIIHKLLSSSVRAFARDGFRRRPTFGVEHRTRPFTKWDALLILIPGLTLFATGLKFSQDSEVRQYLEIVCLQAGCWLRHVSLVLMLLGGANVMLGVARLTVIHLRSSQETVFYMMLQGCFLAIHLSAGLITITARNQIKASLSTNMYRQISHVQDNSVLTATSVVTEVWDSLQMKLKCCGVDSYRDYILHANRDKKELVPYSCCVLRNSRLEFPPKIDNLAQCQSDARANVESSIFLHMKGCRRALLSWLIHFSKNHVTMVFSSSCSQILGIIYIYLLHTRVLM